jgi:hypothetical protein
MPAAVNIYAVEVMDNANFSEQCTKEVEKEIPSIVTRIIREEKL